MACAGRTERQQKKTAVRRQLIPVRSREIVEADVFRKSGLADVFFPESCWIQSDLILPPPIYLYLSGHDEYCTPNLEGSQEENLSG
jgi:hypothetical protein